MNRTTFLLGVGASIPAGYSSTKCLTKKILASENYYQHTDKKFYPLDDDERPVTDCTTPVVRRIIDWLFKRTKEYFQDRGEPKEPNYEDIYYLASQLRDDATELQNPALLPLICKLKCEMISWPEFEEYCEAYPWSISSPDILDFNKLCSETCHYIEDIVTDLLNHNGECCTKHLEIIKTIHEVDGLELRGIATLAHDTHVERT